MAELVEFAQEPLKNQCLLVHTALENLLSLHSIQFKKAFKVLLVLNQCEFWKLVIKMIVWHQNTMLNRVKRVPLSNQDP